jgi:hypothetical protein
MKEIKKILIDLVNLSGQFTILTFSISSKQGKPKHV